MKLTKKPFDSDMTCQATEQVKVDPLTWVMEKMWNHIFTFNMEAY